MGFIKNIPSDIKQALYSLFVSVMLISGALLMLGSFLDTVSPKDNTAPTAADTAETEEENESTP